MAKVDINNIIDEMVVYLRNKVTDPSSRTTAQTDEFNGDASTVAFTLTKPGAKNVTTVTIGAVTQTFGTDYTVAYDPTSTVVTFTTAPGSGTNNVDITYDYDQTWIYPDMPRKDLRLSSFPRMSVIVVSGVTDPAGINLDGYFTSLILSITAYAEDDDTVRDLLMQAKDNLMDDAKNFYYFNEGYPVNMSPLINFVDGDTRIVQQSMDYEIPLLFES